ncbi:unnamed protein product [Amoebophrya sp. A25]|nr:unnamed protein product [Amoebophrya sp. A25]|eukprot:GSA25T00002673001.1
MAALGSFILRGSTAASLLATTTTFWLSAFPRTVVAETNVVQKWEQCSDLGYQTPSAKTGPDDVNSHARTIADLTLRKLQEPQRWEDRAVLHPGMFEEVFVRAFGESLVSVGQEWDEERRAKKFGEGDTEGTAKIPSWHNIAERVAPYDDTLGQTMHFIGQYALVRMAKSSLSDLKTVWDHLAKSVMKQLVEKFSEVWDGIENYLQTLKKAFEEDTLKPLIDHYRNGGPLKLVSLLSSTSSHSQATQSQHAQDSTITTSTTTTAERGEDATTHSGSGNKRKMKFSTFTSVSSAQRTNSMETAPQVVPLQLKQHEAAPISIGNMSGTSIMLPENPAEASLQKSFRKLLSGGKNGYEINVDGDGKPLSHHGKKMITEQKDGAWITRFEKDGPQHMEEEGSFDPDDVKMEKDPAIKFWHIPGAAGIIGTWPIVRPGQDNADRDKVFGEFVTFFRQTVIPEHSWYTLSPNAWSHLRCGAGSTILGFEGEIVVTALRMLEAKLPPIVENALAQSVRLYFMPNPVVREFFGDLRRTLITSKVVEVIKAALEVDEDTEFWKYVLGWSTEDDAVLQDSEKRSGVKQCGPLAEAVARLEDLGLTPKVEKDDDESEVDRWAEEALAGLKFAENKCRKVSLQEALQVLVLGVFNLYGFGPQLVVSNMSDVVNKDDNESLGQAEGSSTSTSVAAKFRMLVASAWRPQHSAKQHVVPQHSAKQHVVVHETTANLSLSSASSISSGGTTTTNQKSPSSKTSPGSNADEEPQRDASSDSIKGGEKKEAGRDAKGADDEDADKIDQASTENKDDKSGASADKPAGPAAAQNDDKSDADDVNNDKPAKDKDEGKPTTDDTNKAGADDKNGEDKETEDGKNEDKKADDRKDDSKSDRDDDAAPEVDDGTSDSTDDDDKVSPSDEKRGVVLRTVLLVIVVMLTCSFLLALVLALCKKRSSGVRGIHAGLFFGSNEDEVPRTNDWFFQRSNNGNVGVPAQGGVLAA